MCVDIGIPGALENQNLRKKRKYYRNFFENVYNRYVYVFSARKTPAAAAYRSLNEYA